MPNRLQDISGHTFGRLTAIERAVSTRPGTYWKCKCQCGNEVTRRKSQLYEHATPSCGCYVKERARALGKAAINGNRARTNGTLEYFKTNTWSNLQKRTVNGRTPHPRNTSYLRRGIELRMSKDEFYAWCDLNSDLILGIYASGLTPSLDRLDPEGHYSTNNISILEVNANRRARRQAKDVRV